MKPRILKNIATTSLVLLLLTLVFAVKTRASVAASAASASIMNRHIPATNPRPVQSVSGGIVIARIEVTCILSHPAVYGTAADNPSSPADCNTYAGTTVTLWSYYSGSYHVLAQNTINLAGCNIVSVGGVRPQCGVVYHVQAQASRWWWAGPPWYVSVNTDSFNVC